MYKIAHEDINFIEKTRKTRKHTNNEMQKKPNDFWLKYGN